ncbi:MAG TPA: carboxymuconolactone decarboxylase family protein [Candidatus Didemnitutus sp.]|nr:carboxymuconolactone decarboxylase family protein [Candidatus Didemnitutus sp.]
MAFVPVDASIPGIRSLFEFRPETGAPLRRLAHALLHGESPLTKGERELIAAFISHGNQCTFCTMSHAAAARHHYGSEADVVDAVVYRGDHSVVSSKLQALLVIAEKVRRGGRIVTDEDVAAARAEGAVDRDIHDAVLISAAFCMFNRYVDGLQALTPRDPDAYIEMGKRMAEVGYDGGR